LGMILIMNIKINKYSSRYSTKT